MTASLFSSAVTPSNYAALTAQSCLACVLLQRRNHTVSVLSCLGPAHRPPPPLNEVLGVLRVGARTPPCVHTRVCGGFAVCCLTARMHRTLPNSPRALGPGEAAPNPGTCLPAHASPRCRAHFWGWNPCSQAGGPQLGQPAPAGGAEVSPKPSPHQPTGLLLSAHLLGPIFCSAALESRFPRAGLMTRQHGR